MEDCLLITVDMNLSYNNTSDYIIPDYHIKK